MKKAPNFWYNKIAISNKPKRRGAKIIINQNDKIHSCKRTRYFRMI